jgi:hypothetical protein
MEEWTSDMLFSFKPSGRKGQKDSVGQEADCAISWDGDLFGPSSTKQSGFASSSSADRLDAGNHRPQFPPVLKTLGEGTI